MDETLIGGYSEGKPGMSHDDKEVVMVAVERLDNGLTEHRAPANRRFRQRNFEQAADETVDKEAAIITNDFSSWVALKKDMPNIKTKKSENGVAFKEMHKQIMLMKMWLKGNCKCP